MVFECVECQNKTDLKFNYQKHLKTNKHFLNLQQCAKKYENVEESMNNNSERNQNLNNNQCQWCRRLFVRKDSLLRHIKMCNKNINQKLTKINQKTHKNNEDYNCDICQKKFCNIYTLKRHKDKCLTKNVNLLIKDVEKSSIQGNRNRNINKFNSDLKFPEVTINMEKSIHSLKCQFCQQIYGNNRSLNKHLKSCLLKNNQIHRLKKDLEDKELQIQKLNYDKDIEIEKLKKEKDLEIEKLEAINLEKDRRIEDKDKTIEIAKQSNSITINNTSNKTINYLNNNFGEMIAMEKFLNALEHTHQLILQERKDLLIAYQECGIDVFARNFSYIMKQNCKRQLEDQGLTDMKLIPLFCSDGKESSIHKEKQSDGWKTLYDNQSINRMINISNQQIHDSYQTLVPVNGRKRNKVFNEIKKDNHQNKLKQLEHNDNK